MIGIVSGAGPLAGLDVAKKIIEETLAETDQEHLPVMLYSMPHQIPDRSSFLLGQNSLNPGMPIGDLFLKLEKAGCTIAAIACNTAHAQPIFDEAMQVLKNGDSSLQVLNIIDLTIEYIINNSQAKKIGILSTTGSRQQGLYKHPLLNRGYEVIEPLAQTQEKVHDAIYNASYGIKASSSPISDQALGNLKEAMQELIHHGAETLVLGCTELPLAIQQPTFGDTPIVDPNRILARALIAKFNPEKLKQSI
jgi:aspartate racemase